MKRIYKILSGLVMIMLIIVTCGRPFVKAAVFTASDDTNTVTYTSTSSTSNLIVDYAGDSRYVNEYGTVGNKNIHVSMLETKTINNSLKVVSWVKQNGNSGFSKATVSSLCADYEANHPGWIVLGGINADQYTLGTGNGLGVDGKHPYSVQPYYPLVVDNQKYFSNTWMADGSGGSTGNFFGLLNNGDADPLAKRTASSTNGTKLVLTVYNSLEEEIGKFDVDGFNQIPAAGDTSLWTGYYSDTSFGTYLPKNATGTNLYVVGNAELAYCNNTSAYTNVAQAQNAFYGIGRITSKTISATLNKGQFAIDTTDTSLIETLSVGTKIRVQYEYINNTINAYESTMGYHTWQRDGNVDKEVSGSYNTNGRPRSVIGHKNDGTVVLMIIDDYNNTYGTTGYGINAICKAHSIVEAFQMDGGGSAQMAVRNNDGTFSAVTTSADSSTIESQRAILSALLVVVRDPDADEIFNLSYQMNGGVWDYRYDFMKDFNQTVNGSYASTGLYDAGSTNNKTFWTNPTMFNKWKWMLQYFNSFGLHSASTSIYNAMLSNNGLSNESTYWNVRQDEQGFMTDSKCSRYSSSAALDCNDTTNAYGWQTFTDSYVAPFFTYKSSAGSTLPSLSKDGTDFLGWCFNENLSDQPVTSIPQGIIGNKTLYGKFGTKLTALAINGVSEMSKNQTAPYSVDATPSNATYKNVIWSSSNPNVAMINSDGLVTALSSGTTTITARSALETTNNVYTTFTITVTNNVLSGPGISIPSGNIIYYVNDVEKNCPYDSNVNLIAPEVTGKTFIYWTENNKLLSLERSVNIHVNEGSRYNAIYRNNDDSVSIYIDANNDILGIENMPINNPSKPGYKFKEWQEDDSLAVLNVTFYRAIYEISGAEYDWSESLDIQTASYFSENRLAILGKTSLENVKEMGILYSYNGNPLETIGVLQARAIIHSVNNEYSIVVNFPYGKTIYACAYVVDGNGVVKYGTVLTIKNLYSITYDLNDGYFGYLTKDDMLIDFFKDYYNANPSGADTLELFMHSSVGAQDYNGAYKNLTGLGNFKPFLENNATKWQPLIDYLTSLRQKAGKTLWESPYETYSVCFVNYCQGLTSSFGPITADEADGWPKFDCPDTFSGAVDVTLVNPKKEGFTFLGWYDNENFDGDAISLIPSGTSSNQVLFAKWGAKNYIVTLNWSYDSKEEVINSFLIDFYTYLVDRNIISSTLDFVTFSGIGSSYAGSWIKYVGAPGNPTGDTTYDQYCGSANSTNYLNLRGSDSNANIINDDYFFNSTTYAPKWNQFANWLNAGGTSHRIWLESYGTYELIRYITGKQSSVSWTTDSMASYKSMFTNEITYNSSSNSNLFSVTKYGYNFSEWSAANGLSYLELPIDNPLDLSLTAKFIQKSGTKTISYSLNGGSWSWTSGVVTSPADGIDNVSNLPEIFMIDYYSYLKDQNLLNSSTVSSTISRYSASWTSFKALRDDPVAIYNCTSTNTSSSTDGYSQFFFDSATATEATGGFFGTEPYKTKYQNLFVLFYQLTDCRYTDEVNSAVGKTLMGFIIDGYFYGTQGLRSGTEENDLNYNALRAVIPTTTEKYMASLGVANRTFNGYNVSEFTAATQFICAPSKNEYFFGGWYTNPDFSGSPVSNLSTSATLYAKWISAAETTISLTATSTTIDVGSNDNIGAYQIYVYDNTKTELSRLSCSFTSSNSAVANVTAYGTIVTYAAGSVTITVNHGNAVATISLTITNVNPAPEGDYANVFNWLEQYLVSTTLSQNVKVYGVKSGASVYSNFVVLGSVSYFLPAAHSVDTTTFYRYHTDAPGRKYVVIHETGNLGTTATARANASYFVSSTGSSIHYCVDESSIYRVVPESSTAWHAGTTQTSGTYNGGVAISSGNSYGIGIEMCVNEGNDLFMTWQKTAKLTADILIRQGLNLGAIKQHYNFSGKACPWALRNSGLWSTQMVPMLKAEYEYRKLYSGYSITLTSSNPNLLDNYGHVLSKPDVSTTVNYSIKITKNNISQTKNYSVIIPSTIASQVNGASDWIPVA